MFDVGNRERHVVLVAEDSENKACTIEIDDAYQRVVINIYPCFFTATRRQQRKYLLHEFVHTVLHPISHDLHQFGRGIFITPQQVIADTEEATSRVTNIVGALMNGYLMRYRRAYKVYLKLPTRKKKKGLHKKKK